MVSTDTGKLSSYQRRLFIFLSVATFFEGYDFLALTQVLPNLRADLDLSQSQGGFMLAFINFGTVVAFLLVRRVDRWGRRRMLTITIAGYTLFTFFSGFAPETFSFAIFQFFARIFLIAEWATSMVLASEEFPASKRGMVMGLIQGFSSLGSIACAGVVPVILKLTLPFGLEPWRAVYFVGIIPLLILAFARRDLKESKRYEEAKQQGQLGGSFFAIWSSPYRGRMLKLALIWGLTYACTQNAISFWKEFAVAERGFSDDDVGKAITIAAVVAMPLVFAAGPLIDRVGRRIGAIIIWVAGGAGVLGAYGLHGFWPLTLGLCFGIVGASAVLPVLNAYTAELFPTHFRGDAFAWTNNLLGRIGYVLSPALVGVLAESWAWGPAVQVMVVPLILALLLILVWMPETKSLELEESSAL